LITAVDADTGNVRWKYRSNKRLVSGLTPGGEKMVAEIRDKADFMSSVIRDASGVREVSEERSG
jgi:hypothetical protein